MSSGVATVVLTASKALAVIGVVLGAATLRVIVSGEHEIAESTAALRAGDAFEAAVHARRAAGWYWPGAPHVRVAYERLIALATTAEGLGDGETALVAWRAVRSAAIETRWLTTPHEADLLRANEAIARLTAAGPRAPKARTEPTAVIERQQLELLLRDETPRTGWIVALLTGFVAWSAGAAWFVRRAVSATGHVTWARATPALVVTGCGVLLWLLAIWRA